MKKLILTTITSLTILAGAFAQCVPGSDYPSANFADSLFGAWPDTTVGFPDADQGVYYSQNLTFKIPLDGGEIDPLYTGLAIDSFWVDTVIGLPPCLSYSTNNPNGSYLGGELGCIEIFGTCNTTGSYDVTIKTLGWATLVVAFSVPYDFVGYHIEVNPPCNISLTASGNDASTTGGSDGDAMAMATGGQGNVTYMWSNGGTTSMISGLIAGTYGVTVMDDILAGCEAIGSVTVSEPPAGCLIAVTASGTNVTSNGGSDGSAAASISGELGNITYAWSNSETTSAIVNITAGVYTVTVTDDIVTGCSASATVTITEPALTCDILVNLSVTAATTAGGSDGAAEALVSGAQGNLSYMWSNGGTTSMITGLPTNTYSVTVSDDVVAGCTASASGLVTDPSVTPPCNLSVSIMATNVTANGGADGTAMAIVTGAGGSLTYLWSNTATTSAINALTAGTYFVVVTDDVEPGCSETAFVTITEPTSIIEETNGGFDFNVFPNPNNGEFVLSFDQNSGDKQTNLKVTNSLGQIIYAEALLLKQGNQQFTISLNEISAGIYYVTVGPKTKPLLISKLPN